MSSAMRIDQLDPPAAEALEGVDLRRVDHVLNDASDHTSAYRPRIVSPVAHRHDERGPDRRGAEHPARSRPRSLGPSVGSRPERRLRAPPPSTPVIRSYRAVHHRAARMAGPWAASAGRRQASGRRGMSRPGYPLAGEPSSLLARSQPVGRDGWSVHARRLTCAANHRPIRMTPSGRTRQCKPLTCANCVRGGTCTLAGPGTTGSTRRL
jgi:hypothetical protein